MGTAQLILRIFLWHVIAVQSFQSPDDGLFRQDFQGLFDSNWLFPVEGNFNFPSFDTIFSSWQKWTPDFHMLDDISPVMDFPRVQVFCDDVKLTLLVDKKAFGHTLTAEEIQLGNGCYSNKEQRNQLLFIYNLDQCGTTSVLQDGLQAFTNTLYLNLKEPATLRQAPSTIQIACIPKRSYTDSNLVSQPFSPVKRFDIQAMNPFWTRTAESNVYKRGLGVRLQVSAETRPGQQLFIHSCFVSASPEPQVRPRHAVILNKGCASSLGSPYPVAQFVASNRADLVNIMLNTSYLIAEFYVHCSVALSDQGVNAASKSCNYNVTSSRWEMNGDTEVCACCGSKCKGPSIKNLPNDAKGVVKIGPLLVVDDWWSPALPDSTPLDESGSSLPTTMMSATPHPGENVIVSAASLTQADLQSSPQGVLVLRQEPTTRLALWLPGQVQGDGLYSQSLPVQDGYSVQEVSTIQGNSKTLPIDEIAQSVNEAQDDSPQWDMKMTLVDGWQIPQQNEIIAEGFQGKSRSGRAGNSDTEATQLNLSLPTEINVNLRLVEKPEVTVPEATEDASHMKWSPDDGSTSSATLIAAAMEPEVQPVIRTKLEFSKGSDGSKKLSYEEVAQQDRRTAVLTHAKDDFKKRLTLKGLHATFLDLLRRMDKEE